MSEDELATIEARARRYVIDVPLPRCTHDEERGHAPWCNDCDREQRERIGPTFEMSGRGDVVALVAEVRRLTAERDAAFNRGAEAMREAAMKACGRVEDEAELSSEGDVAMRCANRIRALKVAP